MENTKRIMVLIIATVLVSGMIQAGEQPQAKLSNTRQASCMVKVTCDPVVLPLSFETIDYLLRSSGVGGKAAREVLDVSPDQVQDLFIIEYVHELISDATSKSPSGRSSGLEGGINEYEYAMMMEAEYSEMYNEMMNPSGSTQSTRSSKGSRRPRRIQSTGRTLTTSDFPVNEQTYLFSLHIQLPEPIKPAAEEFMDCVLFNLKNALIRASDEHVQKLNGQLKIADEEAAQAEHDLSRKREELRNISGSRILDRDSVLAEIEKIRSDIQKIKMEQDSDQVMVDATTKQIAEIQAKMQKEINTDAVIKELKELLALQQQNFQQVEKFYKNGSTSLVDDLADAQEKLVRSRIELAQRREQLSKSAGGNLIESLNSTLTNYSLNATQNQMKLVSLAQQLKDAEELLCKTDDYELLSLKTDIAKQSLQETILWRDRMSRHIRMVQPPSVSVIGGD